MTCSALSSAWGPEGALQSVAARVPSFSPGNAGLSADQIQGLSAKFRGSSQRLKMCTHTDDNKVSVY